MAVTIVKKPTGTKRTRVVAAFQKTSAFVEEKCVTSLQLSQITGLSQAQVASELSRMYADGLTQHKVVGPHGKLGHWLIKVPGVKRRRHRRPVLRGVDPLPEPKVRRPVKVSMQGPHFTLEYNVSLETAKRMADEASKAP